MSLAAKPPSREVILVLPTRSAFYSRSTTVDRPNRSIVRLPAHRWTPSGLSLARRCGARRARDTALANHRRMERHIDTSRTHIRASATRLMCRRVERASRASQARTPAESRRLKTSRTRIVLTLSQGLAAPNGGRSRRARTRAKVTAWKRKEKAKGNYKWNYNRKRG